MGALLVHSFWLIAAEPHRGRVHFMTISDQLLRCNRRKHCWL